MAPRWPGDVDDVITGDITAAAAYLTPAGGVVVTGVAPCGLSDPEKGTVGFTSSLAFAAKLGRLIRNPRAALAYHSREHGFGASSRFVLVDGRARLDLTPSRTRLEAFAPQAVRYIGTFKEGPVWNRLLHEYYLERVFVDIDVRRVVVWPDLAAAGVPTVFGGNGEDAANAAATPAPPAQSPPRGGAEPRIDVAKTAARLAGLPHRLLGYRGPDGFPVVVPVEVAGHDRSGLRLVASPGLLPEGGRRAGLLAHAYRPQLVGLRTRTHTGWLEVDGDRDGAAVYAPHTVKGFAAPSQKTVMLISNGLFAKYGAWKARRDHVLETLERQQAEAASSSGR
jgi:hypothetical protein